VPFHPEAALFCLAWVLLAAAGFILEGWAAGILLSLGLLTVIMTTSAQVISRTEDYALERTIRWSILIAAGVILSTVHALGR
jgi:Na+-translocating ferredoxin:NAD+ oxidoreductase RnfE subunit